MGIEHARVFFAVSMPHAGELFQVHFMDHCRVFVLLSDLRHRFLLARILSGAPCNVNHISPIGQSLRFVMYRFGMGSPGASTISMASGRSFKGDMKWLVCLSSYSASFS